MRRLASLGAALLIAFGIGAHAQSSLPRVNPGGLKWDGAFRLPGGTFGNSSFYYGGWALAYNPVNDSLFIVGHDHQQSVAEIITPVPVKTTSLSALPVASVRQPFDDPTEGRISQIDNYHKQRIGGLLVFGGRLIGAAYSFFDADLNAVSSHFTHSLTLGQNNTVTGMHRVGASNINPGFYAGNMGLIPAAWQAVLGGPAFTGQCCLSIINRTSFGPSAFVFDPAQLRAPASSVPAAPLVYYPENHPLQPWNASNTVEFNNTTEMAGAFIPEGSRSLLFVGRHGTGPFCYRCWRPNPYCSNDVQAEPYQVQVWGYDLNDLVAVKSGQTQPWVPRPYAIWALTGNVVANPLPFFSSCMSVRGLAYDGATQRVWIAAQMANGDLPVIHQFHLDLAGTPSPAPGTPAPPTTSAANARAGNTRAGNARAGNARSGNTRSGNARSGNAVGSPWTPAPERPLREIATNRGSATRALTSPERSDRARAGMKRDVGGP